MVVGALIPFAFVVADLTRETPARPAPVAEASQISTRAKSEPEWRLVRAGAVSFGVAYAVCVGGAAAEGFDRPSARLAIPVAGPWLALDSGINPWALVMAGTAQAAGATLIVWGFASPRRVLGPAEASVAVTAAPGLRLDVRF
ncbi:MAG: hypothetical protein HYZ29_12165 [Myxococcales bacterium]|nr:hypothetical protein [Myxococcales bacterium]